MVSRIPLPGQGSQVIREGVYKHICVTSDIMIMSVFLAVLNVYIDIIKG